MLDTLYKGRGRLDGSVEDISVMACSRPPCPLLHVGPGAVVRHTLCVYREGYVSICVLLVYRRIHSLPALLFW